MRDCLTTEFSDQRLVDGEFLNVPRVSTQCHINDTSITQYNLYDFSTSPAILYHSEGW